MRRSWPFVLVGAVTGTVGSCLWYVNTEHPLWVRTFDLGRGHTLRVWCTRYPPLNFEDFDFPAIYYRVDDAWGERVHTTYIGVDAGSPRTFRTVATDGGELVCVYEDRGDGPMVFAYHAPSNESWPRLRDDESSTDLRVLAKWRERFDRLRAADPAVPLPGRLEPAPGTARRRGS